jgi:hypothetical protein
VYSRIAHLCHLVQVLRTPRCGCDLAVWGAPTFEDAVGLLRPFRAGSPFWPGHPGRWPGLSTSIHKYGDVCETRPEAGMLSTGFTGQPGFENEGTNLWAISRSAPAFGGALAWPKLIRLKTGRTGFTESCTPCSSCREKIRNRIYESEH